MEKKDESKLEASICLKCGSQISHIPYRYNGQVFHARCLLCNACGKRLIGKPFITNSRQIFCGDKCQESFVKGKSPKPPVDLPHSEPTYGEEKQFVPAISLQEVIDSMPGSNSRSRSDLHRPHPLPPPSRITDYPVSSSPVSSHTHSFRSETDSMSTLSESSFTSDSSYAYDAHRKPQKKILKSSNAPKRRHKNSVRWNFNNLESVSDADSVSLDSSSSYNSYVPPTSHIHAHSREVTARTLQNWKDFEHPLPPGSTGLTPNRTRGLSQSQQLLHTTPPKMSLYRTFSGDIPSPSHSTASHHRGLRHVISVDSNHFHNHSSPLSSTPLTQTGTSHGYSLSTHSNGPVLNVPVFRLDEENLPELEQSNLEERKKRHLFQIPQPTRSSSLQTLQEDDKDDYDHLPQKTTQSPPQKITQERQSPPQKTARERLSPSQKTAREIQSPPQKTVREIQSPSQKTARERLAPLKSDDQWYSNEDIEEALQLINNDDSPSDDEYSIAPPPVPPKTNKKLPPPPPPKRSSSLSVLTKPHSFTPPSLQNEEDLTHTESITILPPPPEEPLTHSKSTENSLHSPSMETLKNYAFESSPLDDGLTSEVHPETPNSTTADLGFSWGSPLRMKERIVEGAEDPHRNPSPTHVLILKNSSTDDISRDVITNSLVTRHNSLSPKTNRTDYTDSSFSTNLRRVNTSPYDLSSSSTNSSPPVELTKHEEDVVKWLKQPRTMKPVIVDTDKEIEQMMDEIEGKPTRQRHSVRSTSSLTSSSSSLTSTRQKYFGTCSVCQKDIENSCSLFSFASRLYHTKCFCCAQCGCPLRGKQIYTIRGTLVCPEDYNKITNLGSTHSLPAVALKNDSTRDPVLFQRIVHSESHVTNNGSHMTKSGSHMTNNGDHIHRHNSATMV